MDRLIDYVCDELEVLEKKATKAGGLSAAEVQYADTLAHLKKNLLKGEMLHEEMGEYSGDMPYRYHDGTSYARRGNVRRDAMGRYSSDDWGYSRAASEMVEKLEELMHDAPNDQIRKDVEKLIHKVKSL